MAEKDTKPKTTQKPSATVKPVTKPTTAAKPAATAKPTTTAAPKSTGIAGSAATKQPAAKPAATAKPATTAAPKSSGIAGSAATKQPADKAAKPAATAKPATTTAPKSSGIAGSAASKQPAAKAAKPAANPANKPAAAAAAPKSAEKPKTTAQPKEKKAKQAKSSGGKGKSQAVAATKNNKIRIIAIAAVAVVLVVALILGIALGVKSCKNSKDPFSHFSDLVVASADSSHKNKTQVGYSAEIVSTTDRYKPVGEVRNEGLSTKGYPKYGSTLNLTTTEKTTLIQENRKLTANGTWVDSSFRTTGTYDLMDKDGYLYKKEKDSEGNYLKPGDGVPERLYKHTGSVGLYGGDVADDEPAVVKKLTFRPRSYGSYYNVTGLYAPAGEVIKIQLTNEDMTETGGLTIHIGQALYNGQANNIWEQRNFNRMPVILNTMVVTKETATYDEDTDLWTAYVGSFLGGPIYVRSASSTFSVTISGGVNYAHFILGVTTEKEYEVYSKSSAPYFDLEVWDRGVLHSGPKRAAKQFSYNDLYKAAVLWEKIALVTTSVSNQGIVFLYDPFVAAGAAVAFPGRRSVNCPEGWMGGSLNYESFVTSGSWGNLHEYHHNFQDYGVGYTGEVTNNGLNLVSYSLFTKISSARQLGNNGGAGLSGWNQYTSATWATQRMNNGLLNNNDHTEYGLSVYATLLHNLGQDAYINARGASGSAYYDKWANLTHQDMTYFADIVSSYGGNYTPSQAVKDANYPLFVPVSCVYQTGRTYEYDGETREITTMQPYVIPYGEAFTVDLNAYTAEGGQYRSGSVVIGNRTNTAAKFYYKIKSVNTDKVNGTFKETDKAGVYTFTPNKELLSGKIYVTLEIYNAADDSRIYQGHALDDVNLILEFQQSHESNKNILERTTYFYTADTAYTDAKTAYEQGYAGYENKNDRNHSNPTQNCNTDIWYCTETSISKFPKANPETDIVKPYSIDEIRGKLYFPEAGKYNIYLRGRKSCAVYYSVDGGKTYKLGTFIQDDSTTAEFRADKYFTLELEAESWVYFKEVLINVKISDSMAGFIGLGIGQWTVPMYTTEVKYYTEVDGARKDLSTETVDGAMKYYYNKDGNKVYVENNTVKSDTIYKNASGQQVSAEEAANTELQAPTLKTINYATAYRQTYEFQKQFESDYFYTRNYSYDYKDNVWANKTQTLVADQCKYTPPPVGWGWGNFPIENLVDGNRGTYAHTQGNVSESAPLVFVIDMGEVKTVNRMIIYSQSRSDLQLPKSFTLQGSLDGIEYFDVGKFVDVPNVGAVVTVDFEEKQFRYYKLTVTKSSKSLIIIGEIEMWNINEILGATMYSPDDAMFTYKGSWRIAQTNADFGHVYLGKSGNQVSFEFEAKSDSCRLGILSSNKYGQNFEIQIDGKKVATEKLSGDPNDRILLLTGKLAEGKHKVVIKCKGEANIDSIVIYP